MLIGERLEQSKDVDRCVDVTIDALDVTRFAPTSLTICFDNSLWNIYATASRPTGREMAKRVFQSLKYLQIRTQHPLEDTGQESAKEAASLFDSCPDLETLRRDNYSKYQDQPESVDDDYFISALLAQDHPSLEDLSLRGYLMSFPEVALYINRRSQLKSASFDSCRFHTSAFLATEQKGKGSSQGERIANAIRDVNRLRNIKAPDSTVREWDEE